MRDLQKGELQTGDPAPNFTLHTVDGNPVTLSDSLSSKSKVLLVFLRHLG
jgi:peroxiredoxin